MAEGEDSRIVEGSLRAAEDGLARITLLGTQEKVREVIQGQGHSPDSVTILDPNWRQRLRVPALAYPKREMTYGSS